MGSISGKNILDEFFNLWLGKVRAGLTPKQGLEKIKRDEPDLFAFAEIFNQRIGGAENAKD